MLTNILLTGFEPFGGMTTNPSEDVVRLIERTPIPGVSLDTLLLPVEYHRAMELIRSRVGQYDLIIMMGVARTRQEVSIERVAINLMDAASWDNSGYRPEEEPIVTDGPAAYFSTLPVKQLAADMQQAGLPCKVSNTAGTFVCNAVYYTVLHTCVEQRLNTRAVFIHLPGRVDLSQFARMCQKMLYHCAQNRISV